MRDLAHQAIQFCVLLVAGTWLAAACIADDVFVTVHLADGERVSGALVRFDHGRLVLEVSPGGTDRALSQNNVAKVVFRGPPQSSTRGDKRGSPAGGGLGKGGLAEASEALKRLSPPDRPLPPPLPQGGPRAAAVACQAIRREIEAGRFDAALRMAAVIRRRYGPEELLKLQEEADERLKTLKPADDDYVRAKLVCAALRFLCRQPEEAAAMVGQLRKQAPKDTALQERIDRLTETMTRARPPRDAREPDPEPRQ